METRSSWGIVYVAAIFAVLVIAAALITSYVEKKTRNAEIVAVTKSFSPWDSVSNTAAITAPSGNALSGAVSQDVLTGYNALLDKGTFTPKEEQTMFQGIVQKNMTSPNIVPVIALSDLNIASTSLDNYLALLGVILSKSVSVKHYELEVFANTVANENKNGTVALASDAILYQKIAAAILLMETPPALASEHLEVVKSVGALSKAVSNMSSWSGDPIEALTDVDSFNKVQAYVQNSLNNLLAAATKLQKKKV